MLVDCPEVRSDPKIPELGHHEAKSTPTEIKLPRAWALLLKDCQTMEVQQYYEQAKWEIRHRLVDPVDLLYLVAHILKDIQF